MTASQVAALFVIFVAAQVYAVLLGRYLSERDRWSRHKTALAAATLCLLGTLVPVIFLGPKPGLIAMGILGFFFVWPAFAAATRILATLKE